MVKGLFKTNVFKFSFFNRMVDLWNCLPIDFRTIEHFSSFKNSINKFHLNKFNANKDRFLQLISDTLSYFILFEQTCIIFYVCIYIYIHTYIHTYICFLIDSLFFIRNLVFCINWPNYSDFVIFFHFFYLFQLLIYLQFVC